MLVTLIAIICNSDVCVEKVVTTSELSGITMASCAISAQIGLSDWLSSGPYRDWEIRSYRCVEGIPPRKA